MRRQLSGRARSGNSPRDALSTSHSTGGRSPRVGSGGGPGCCAAKGDGVGPPAVARRLPRHERRNACHAAAFSARRRDVGCDGDVLAMTCPVGVSGSPGLQCLAAPRRRSDQIRSRTPSDPSSAKTARRAGSMLSAEKGSEQVFRAHADRRSPRRCNIIAEGAPITPGANWCVPHITPRTYARGLHTGHLAPRTHSVGSRHGVLACVCPNQSARMRAAEMPSHRNNQCAKRVRRGLMRTPLHTTRICEVAARGTSRPPRAQSKRAPEPEPVPVSSLSARLS